MTAENMKIAIVIFFFLVTIACFLGSPFLTIWSLNVLFHTEIAYSFSSYVAMLWVTLLLCSFRLTYKNAE
jgi:hypothetical protein